MWPSKMMEMRPPCPVFEMPAWHIKRPVSTTIEKEGELLNKLTYSEQGVNDFGLRVSDLQK
ncbi:MAG: hypothetical protein KAJ00_11750 [Deltaproteobacteria bacterium]|nr:hypothetical protein [Deltaproteobacteria bacterium]